MYNLTVAQAHTFFVGEQQWLVHNECDGNVHIGETSPNLYPVKMDQRGRFHAAEDFTYLGNGRSYKKGQYVPDPRRPDLPRRIDGGWQRGQLTDAEYDALRDFATRNNKQIVLSGSLSETDLGLRNRYSGEFPLPDWRAKKPHTGLVDTGIGDSDFWQGSNLSQPELDELAKIFPENFKKPDTGYSLEHYPALEDFSASGQGAGALVFEPDGSTWRVPATWQETKLLDGIPSNVANYPHFKQQLAFQEAASSFLWPSGELHPEVIRTSSPIIPGSKLGNSEVVRELTSNGSQIQDWAKYTSKTIRGPSFDFQIHFYYNKLLDQVNYSIDYKIIPIWRK